MWIHTYLILIGIFHDAAAIYFGKLAQEGQFKYMALLMEIDDSWCSGVIIDSYHILTAAHCVTCLKPEDLIVTVGTVDLISESSIDRHVRTIHIHPEFEQPTESECSRSFFKEFKCRLIKFLKLGQKKRADDDIAVVTLKKSLPLGENIISVTLPQASPIPECTPLDFPGWGDSEDDDRDFIRLRYTRMVIYTPPWYDVFLPAIQKGFYVIDINERSYAGHGDSGSPLVAGDIVYGIALGSFCIEGGLTIFLKVHDYLDFIQSAMKDTTSLG